MTPTIKNRLEAEKRLTGYINELEAHRAELPEGAFQWLTTAEGEMQNQRALLERKGRK